MLDKKVKMIQSWVMMKQSTKGESTAIMDVSYHKPLEKDLTT
jgi:hypothetical protein